jgi:hypothetical protein
MYGYNSTCVTIFGQGVTYVNYLNKTGKIMLFFLDWVLSNSNEDSSIVYLKLGMVWIELLTF